MAKVRILHFSDPHNDHEAIDQFVAYANSRKDIDLVACSGDILGPCLNGQQAQSSYESLEELLDEYGEYIKSEKDFRRAIAHAMQEGSFAARKAAKTYSELEGKFDKTSQEHYLKFKAAMGKLKAEYVLIPGNWDSPKTYLEVLGDNNIHGGAGKVGNMIMAGYGGANMFPKFNPQTRIMPYDEKEYADFLRKAKPDIIISHMPPTNPEKKDGELTSKALTEHIERYHPKLVLCGHSHEAYTRKIGTTTVVNSGNLGAYFNQKHKGTFAEIEIDDDKVIVTHYQLRPDGTVEKVKL